MKVVYVALAAAGLAAAHPHQHGHQHQHLHAIKRDDGPSVVVVTIPGPTAVVYSLNGKIISEDEVQQGIADGTLIWANGAPQVNTAAAAAPVQKQAAAAPVVQQPEPVTTTTAEANTPAPTPTATQAASSPSASGVDTDFPDGEVDCSDFPSDYGAVSLDWLGLGGWSGIQNPGQASGNSYSNVDTVNSAGCTDGTFCSYACPPGYQKTQWPSTQGATGQSVGGLQCSGGKLHLTNSGLSTKLCMQGASEVSVTVENQLSQQVSVCRTDYPGTESETIPVSVAPGATAPLACPDAGNYFVWGGKSTSAQYYVNPAGVGVEDACQWGDGNSPIGNWAPLNIGVGYSNGRAYVSMFPNKPTTNANLEYKVTVTAEDSGESCVYQNGAFTSTVGGDGSGCTVSAATGNLKYVFSN